LIEVGILSHYHTSWQANT